MDTEYDFLKPEFLNILFFQQKSLVIFPYVDVKHIHSLEIFAMGYNIVDLDSTAIHNFTEFLELGNYNLYSQNPSFFFITNVNGDQLAEIMELENIHCVINSNEGIKPNVKGDHFIFYNKKNKTFLNYAPEGQDLTFEKSLINSSKNISILQDKILKIKTIATKIFTELNDSGSVRTIARMLSEIEPQYWDKVSQFTRLFYGIEVPEIPNRLKFSNQVKKSLTNLFSHEYDLIISQNKKIGKEFMKLLHDYRTRKVNPANLDLEQLYFPRNLYDYLRNHHWKNGIDKEFIAEWVKMGKTKYQLGEEDLSDFHTIFTKLDIPRELLLDIAVIENETVVNGEDLNLASKIENDVIRNTKETSNEVPAVNDFSQFKSWILKKLEEIERLLNIED